jgi:hypothetical protein
MAMRQEVKVVLLAVVMGTGCIGDGCGCSPEAAASGCVADTVTGGTAVPPAAPAAPANGLPRIAGLIADPVVIRGREASTHITADVTDPDSDPVAWTLALDPSSTATGVFRPASGTGGTIDSRFIGTGTGSAVIRATASDGRGGTVSTTVTVSVVIG